MKRVSLLLALAACGSGTPPQAPDAGPPVECEIPAADRLLPLAVGTTWLYDVTTSSGTVAKQSTVEAVEDVGAAKEGTIAYRVRTEKIDGSTVSWQADTCSSVVRHREQSLTLGGAILSDEIYEPSKLRVDETPPHLVAGATWTDTYAEVTVSGTVAKTETWTVVATDEQIATDAGAFTCVHLRRSGDANDAIKNYWFAAGVGKVREEGEQIEELIGFTVP